MLVSFFFALIRKKITGEFRRIERIWCSILSISQQMMRYTYFFSLSLSNIHIHLLACKGFHKSGNTSSGWHYKMGIGVCMFFSLIFSLSFSLSIIPFFLLEGLCFTGSVFWSVFTFQSDTIAFNDHLYCFHVVMWTMFPCYHGTYM